MNVVVTCVLFSQEGVDRSKVQHHQGHEYPSAFSAIPSHRRHVEQVQLVFTIIVICIGTLAALFRVCGVMFMYMYVCM